LAVRRKRGLTRAERNIAWIEEFCRVPEGARVGQKVELRDWQKDIIRGIYGTPTRTAIISLGRKNSKTTTAAFLLLLHLCGPEARPNSQLYSAAQSREQAAVLFGLAAKMVRQHPVLKETVVIRDSAKQLFCPELGTVYRALSAEASTAYGLSPVFVVHDELGQVVGPRSELYEALETAMGAHEAPLSIAISTQAATDADLFSVLIDDAKTGRDPRTKLWLWTADLDADPFDVETIKQANPAFGDFLNAEEVMRRAEDARAMPSREAEYRNLILNQRVEASNPFVTRSVWQANGKKPLADLSGRIVYAGFDLSSVNDLTAMVLAAPVDGVLHVHAKFWLPEEGLREKSAKDRVPYDVWAQEGLVRTTPGRSIRYEDVAIEIAQTIRALNIRRAAFDRWNWENFKPWLVKAGISEEELELIFQPFGQGFQSMSPALRELEAMLLNERVCHGDNPVLTMCAANAVVKMDEAGNRKFAKNKSSGRIDGIVALAMAASLAAQDMHDMAARSYLEDGGLLVL